MTRLAYGHQEKVNQEDDTEDLRWQSPAQEEDLEEEDREEVLQ